MRDCGSTLNLRTQTMIRNASTNQVTEASSVRTWSADATNAHDLTTYQKSCDSRSKSSRNAPLDAKGQDLSSIQEAKTRTGSETFNERLPPYILVNLVVVQAADSLPSNYLFSTTRSKLSSRHSLRRFGTLTQSGPTLIGGSQVHEVGSRSISEVRRLAHTASQSQTELCKGTYSKPTPLLNLVSHLCDSTECPDHPWRYIDSITNMSMERLLRDKTYLGEYCSAC